MERVEDEVVAVPPVVLGCVRAVYWGLQNVRSEGIDQDYRIQAQDAMP